MAVSEVKNIEDFESLISYLSGLPLQDGFDKARRLLALWCLRTLPNAVLDEVESKEGTKPLLSFFLHVSSSLSKIEHAKEFSDVRDYEEFNWGTVFTLSHNLFQTTFNPTAGSEGYWVFEPNLAADTFPDTVGQQIYEISSVVKDFQELGITENDFWRLTRRDLSEARMIAWYDAPPEVFNKKLASVADKLIIEDENWSFWLLWYERVLEGADWHASELWEVLNKVRANFNYQDTSKKVNANFDPLLAIYRAENFLKTNRYGLRALLNSVDERLDIGETNALDISDVVDQIREAIDDFQRRSEKDKSGGNLAYSCAQALLPELQELRKKAEALQEDPQKLHRQLGRYIDLLKDTLKDKDLPHTKETSGLFKDLQYAQDDICVVSEDVRAAEERRASVRITRELDTYLVQAIHNGLSLAADGEGQMRVYAILAVRSLLDEKVSKEEKIAWIQFANRMALESSLLITEHEGAKGDEKSRFGRSIETIKEVKDGVVAADKIGDVLQEAGTELAPLGQRLLEAASASNFGGLF